VLRVVADPKVLVSGLISNSPNAARKQLPYGIQEREVVLVASPHLLGELRAVLARDKFRHWVSIGEAMSSSRN